MYYGNISYVHIIRKFRLILSFIIIKKSTGYPSGPGDFPDCKEFIALLISNRVMGASRSSCCLLFILAMQRSLKKRYFPIYFAYLYLSYIVFRNIA